MKRFLRVCLVLVLVLIGYTLLLASEWLPRPSAGQRAAMEVLHRPLPAVSGKGAFSVLWFITRDADAQRIDELMQQDVEASAQARREGHEFESVASQFPATPVLDRDACAGFPEPCLAELRLQPDQGAQLAEDFAGQLARSEALLEASHYRYPFSLRDPLRIPSMGRTINLRRFANAHRYLDQSPRDGLASTCSELALWRRLRPTTDSLIHHMLAIAFTQSQAGLMAEMLAEWPVNEPLPASCDEALAPLAPAELDQCDAWRGEYAWTEHQVERERGKPLSDEPGTAPGWMSEVFLNRRAYLASYATRLAKGCSDFQADGADTIRWTDWAFDPVGSVMRYHDAVPGLEGYWARFEQHLDVIRALRAQDWLRSQPDLTEAWARLPQDRRPQHLELQLDAASRELKLTLAQPGRDGPDQWTLPLPPLLPARPPSG